MLSSGDGEAVKAGQGPPQAITVRLHTGSRTASQGSLLRE